MASLSPKCFEALISDRKMNCTRLVALITSLLLLAGQAAALVHAADHPFHEPDEICGAFASLEKNAHAIAVLPPNTRSRYYADDAPTAFTRVFPNHVSTGHQARAPPLHT
jgi:hypothetical protein